jgi:dephospho-CoA kinase
VVRIGLTGGIGSGKSEVARRLRTLGALVIDADVVAREVVAKGTPGLAAVVEKFGPAVLGPDGTLDRAALSAIVFADHERRRELNAIVHPLVGQRTEELVAAAPTGAVIVHDVPLLVENGLAPAYDVVVVVDAADDTRVRRLVTSRGMSEPDARSRIAAQASREERLAVADVVIDNNGVLAELDPQVRRLWGQIRQSAN